MKKADVLIYLSIIVLFLVSLISTVTMEKGAEVEVFVNSELVCTYPINENRQLSIEGIDNHILNILIDDKKVLVTNSTCSDKICVKSRSISKSNEAIICLPSKVVITVKGGNSSKYDAVVR